nr:uncharacterized protein LOC120965124 isoform X2 [Aegilops tauschii subsp. strangulata]
MVGIRSEGGSCWNRGSTDGQTRTQDTMVYRATNARRATDAPSDERWPFSVFLQLGSAYNRQQYGEIWQQINLRKEYEHHFRRCTPGLSRISGNERFLFKIYLQNQLIEGPYVELLFKNLLMTVCRTAVSLQGLLAVTLLAILLKIGWPVCRYFICAAVRLGTEAGAFPQGKSSFIGRWYVVDVTISCIFLRSALLASPHAPPERWFCL